VAPTSASVPPRSAVTTPAGFDITVTVKPDATMAIVESLTEKDLPSQVTLSELTRLAGPGVPAGRVPEPRVDGLQANFDGLPLATTVMTPGHRWLMSLPPSAAGRHTIELTYSLAGAAVFSAPGPAGRASLVITPLLQPIVDSVPVGVRVQGLNGGVNGSILALNCPYAAPANVVCGQRAGSTWSAELPAERAADAQRITVQVDLPF
jgi:hypothetical protein